MGKWYSSLRAFEKHKGQLQKILSGQYEFFPDNTDSFAHILRGLIKGVRERQEQGYERLYDATVRIVGSCVKVELGSDDKPSYRAHQDLNVFQIIGEISDAVPNSTYIFTGSKLNQEEQSMVINLCSSLGYTLDIESNKIKIKT